MLLANLAPVLIFPIFFKVKPLDNPSLTERLLELSRRAGTRVKGVFEWKLSEKSKKANAALMGLGNTRRIILSDTLLAAISAMMKLKLSLHTSLATTCIGISSS